MENKLSNIEILEVFKKLQLPNDSNYVETFEVWESHPIPEGTKIFFESY